MKLVLVFLIVFLATFCSATHKMNLPPDFVRYRKPKDSLKAINAEGVRLKTSRFPNEPEGDLTLWATSIQQQLEKMGYQVTHSQEIWAGNLKGMVKETQAYYAGNQFVYLIAVFVKEDSVFTVEVVGEKVAYDKVRLALLESLKTFTVEEKLF